MCTIVCLFAFFSFLAKALSVCFRFMSLTVPFVSFVPLLLSDLYDQEMGVPQGSILSVTFFSLKINSLVEVLKSNIEGSLYVDDFLICYRGKNMNNIERQLQLCLGRIEKWASENGFKFSTSKTVGMHFCNKRKLHLDPELTLYGNPIKMVDETKFLGFTFR